MAEKIDTGPDKRAEKEDRRKRHDIVDGLYERIKENGAIRTKRIRWHKIPKNAHSSISAAFPSGAQRCSVTAPGDEFSFMVIREPFGRACSMWKMFCNEHDKWNYFHQRLIDLGYSPDMTLLQFLENYLYKDNFMYDEHSAPQTTWLGKGVDLLVPFDQLPRYWLLLRAVFPELRILPHTHKTSPLKSWDTKVYSLREKINRTLFADYALWQQACQQSSTSVVDRLRIVETNSAWLPIHRA